MSVQLRWEQCCQSPGCKRPARFGDLCTACYLAATPARRAVELRRSDRGRHEVPSSGERVVDCAGAAWLRELWAA